MGSELRKMTKEGQECRCHISPPCDWCCAMAEAEVSAWANDGMYGLEALWAKQDMQDERDAATARAEAAEQRAAAAEAEVARLRAAGRVIACQWRAVDDMEDLNYFALCWDLAHPESAKLECDRGVSAGLALGNDPSLDDLVAALRLMLAETQPAEVTDV